MQIVVKWKIKRYILVFGRNQLARGQVAQTEYEGQKVLKDRTSTFVEKRQYPVGAFKCFCFVLHSSPKHPNRLTPTETRS